MKKEQFFLSTIDNRAPDIARDLGLGLELAQFCTARNMDEDYHAVSHQVIDQLTGIRQCLMHGPFNELFPCAIDPRARALATERYCQALALAEKFGAKKLILHAGFQPYQYFPIWFIEQSIEYWKEFLRNWQGSMCIVLENVMESDPKWLLEIVQKVDDPRLRICLDVGHAFVYSKVPVENWVQMLSPWLSHFHLHNNSGDVDLHDPLFRGSIQMESLIPMIDTLCPDATVTAEVIDNTENLDFLKALQ